MEVLRTVAEMRAWTAAARGAGRRIGFVPTMGALHHGHQALIADAASRCPAVAVSIFVNPTQFGPREDFAAYPRDLEGDSALAAQAGATVVFAPSVEEMYPLPLATLVESPELAAHLCGPFRPGHFIGVATVVMKLLNIVQPDEAVFGEKDYQQLAVIRRMAQDVNLPVAIVAHPMVRDPDGLAASSRNRYLSEEDRAAARALYRGLQGAARRAGAGERSAAAVRFAVLEALASEPRIAVEYVEVVDAGTLQPVEEVAGSTLVALAARVGKSRLIDNIVISA